MSPAPDDSARRALSDLESTVARVEADVAGMRSSLERLRSQLPDDAAAEPSEPAGGVSVESPPVEPQPAEPEPREPQPAEPEPRETPAASQPPAAPPSTPAAAPAPPARPAPPYPPAAGYPAGPPPGYPYGPSYGPGYGPPSQTPRGQASGYGQGYGPSYGAPAGSQSGSPWTTPGSRPAQQRPAGSRSSPYAPTPHPRTPRKSISPSTVIAAIGGAVLLLGVVFLLVLAAQAGFFGPVPRVVSAAVLAAGLIGGGIRLQQRHAAQRAQQAGPGHSRETDDAGVVANAGRRPPPVNPGALGLVGTGFATAILDVVAATSMYEWIPAPIAFVLTGLLAVGGLLLARLWHSGLLAGLVSVATMLLSPFLSPGVELYWFVVIVGAATALLAVDLGGWLHVLRAVIPSFFLLVGVSQVVREEQGHGMLLGAILLHAVVGAAAAVYQVLRQHREYAAASMALVTTAVPLLGIPVLEIGGNPWLVTGLVGVAYLVGSGLVLALGRRVPTAPEGEPSPRQGHELLSSAFGAIGSVLLVASIGSLRDLQTVSLAVTLTAAVYVVAAGLLRIAWIELAASLWAIGALLAYLAAAEPYRALVMEPALEGLDGGTTVLSVVNTALALLVGWWVTLRRRENSSDEALIAVAVVALATLSVAIVSLGVMLGRSADAPESGFRGAHLLVTLLWIGSAAWLVLTRSTRLPAARRLGFVLGSLALVKLFVLDLGNLPGLFRVVAFLVVGGVLLAVGTRYAMPDESDGRQPPGPQQPGPNGQRPSSGQQQGGYPPAGHQQPGPPPQPSAQPQQQNPHGPAGGRSSTPPAPRQEGPRGPWGPPPG